MNKVKLFIMIFVSLILILVIFLYNQPVSQPPVVPPVPDIAAEVSVLTESTPNSIWPETNQNTQWLSILLFQHNNREKVARFYQDILPELGWRQENFYDRFIDQGECLHDTLILSYTYEGNEEFQLTLFINSSEARVDTYSGEYFVLMNTDHGDPTCWNEYP